MIGSYLLRNRNPDSKILTMVGLTALAGAAVIFAIPSTRTACVNWLNSKLGNFKKTGKNHNHDKEDGKHLTAKWQHDLEHAEQLKGPLKKRRNTAQIRVPAAGTGAWKDEWSSE